MFLTVLKHSYSNKLFNKCAFFFDIKPLSHKNFLVGKKSVDLLTNFLYGDGVRSGGCCNLPGRS